MRALQGGALAAVALAVLSTLTSSPVGAQPASGPDGIPALGTFRYNAGGDGISMYRGIVHGVRRVPGGTAVYYSLGVAAGEDFNGTLMMARPRVSTSYIAFDAHAVEILDLRGRRIYRPMVGPEGCLCPEIFDFGKDSGTLKVGWAVLPPLPADVKTVTVQVGYGIVENIPVQDGALLPAMPGIPVLGTGWPALPSDAQVAAVPRPDRFDRALVQHTADLERTVTMNEQPGQVAEDLSADVLFPVGSAALSPAARATLQQVAGRVKMRAKGEVTIVGHTDATGSDQDNQRLSEARASAVRDALRPDVGAAVTLVASGRGEAEPVADNESADGRQLNRRVTVTYSVAEGS